MLNLHVALEIPSLNYYVGPKAHWKYYSAKKKWQEQIAMALMIEKANGRVHAMDFPPCKSRRRLTVTAYRNRLIDPGNLDTKALEDALKRERLIVDDSAKWLDRNKVEQVSVGKHGVAWTNIVLENIP